MHHYFKQFFAMGNLIITMSEKTILCDGKFDNKNVRNVTQS